ncbi:glycosyltransferase family 2 protein [Parvularcula mediterranea]|nr:glycosyltransferase family 2 protein [Parvularcula mediterranea]
MTFARACEQIQNWTVGHETRSRQLGVERLNYPEHHIEVDNRLAWFLGRLEKSYGDDALYVHLTRARELVALSYDERWANLGNIPYTYAQGILMRGILGSDTPTLEICRDYVDTVTSNITAFLARRPNTITLDIGEPKGAFADFWGQIGADGDLDAALATFDQRHNSSADDASTPDEDGESESYGQTDSERVRKLFENRILRQADSLRDSLRDANAELGSAVDQIERLNGSVDDLRTDRQQLLEKVKERNEKIRARDEELKQLRGELKTSLAEGESRRIELERRLEEESVRLISDHEAAVESARSELESRLEQTVEEYSAQLDAHQEALKEYQESEAQREATRAEEKADWTAKLQKAELTIQRQAQAIASVRKDLILQDEDSRSLAQTLKSANKSIRQLRESQASLNAELLEMRANSYIQQRTLGFRLGRAIAANSSVTRLPVLPFALIRALQEYRKGKPKLKAALAAQSANDANAAAHGTSRKGKAKKLERSAILFEARNMIADQGIDAAIEFAETHASPIQVPAINLLRATKYRHDTEQWASSVNAYLRSRAASDITVLDGETSLFSRIRSLHSPTPVHDGPLVSVIMPAFKAEKTIEHAARSILNQSWRNLELIIIDDCSPDATWAAIERLKAEDPRVVGLRNERNVGPYVSKNIGLTLAQGEFVTGQDADDWSFPERLADQMEFLLAGNDATAVLSYMIRVLADGSFDHLGKYGSFSRDGAMRIASISCLLPKALLRDRLGFWDSVRFGADSEMITRVEMVLGRQLVRLPTISMICLDEPTSLTNHADHGVSKVTGVSNVRQDYRNNYTDWHKGLPTSRPFMPFPQEVRPFPAPDAMRVTRDDVEVNLEVASDLQDGELTARG